METKEKDSGFDLKCKRPRPLKKRNKSRGKKILAKSSKKSKLSKQKIDLKSGKKNQKKSGTQVKKYLLGFIVLMF